MSDFMEEKTPEESLGAYLKRVRENRGFSLEDFSKKTRVSLEHLREIEAGEWNKFPVEAYVRGYLNSISVVLRLDMPKILEYYSKESGSSYSKEFVAPASFASETEPLAGGKVGSNKAGTKVFIVVLLVLAAAIFVGMNFLKKMEGESVPSPVTPQAVEAEEDASSFETAAKSTSQSVISTSSLDLSAIFLLVFFSLAFAQACFIDEKSPNFLPSFSCLPDKIARKLFQNPPFLYSIN